MKKHLLFLCVTFWSLSTYAAPPRVIVNPLIDAANTQLLDISKIELSDTATVLHVDTYFQPNGSMGINSAMYLLADGQKYPMRGSEGIRLDSMFRMPASGSLSFRLRFAPLPGGAKSFDMIESYNDNSFRIYGVDLSGRKEYPLYPDGLPESLQKPLKDGSIPEPVLKRGETMVRVHLLGYRQGMAKRVQLYENVLLGGRMLHAAEVDPATGVATLSFEQNGSALMFLDLTMGPVWVAPGETMDLYLDMRESGKKLFQRRNNVQNPPRDRKLYATGVYDALNMQADMLPHRLPGMDHFSPKFADYKIGADEYAQMIESKYKTLADSISRDKELSKILKELALINLQQETIGLIVNSEQALEYPYRRANNIGYREKIDFKFAKTTPEHVAAICKLFDVSNPKLLIGSNLPQYQEAILNTEIDLPRLIGAKDSFVAALPRVQSALQKAADGSLTEADIEPLRTFREPFYAEVCQAALVRIQKMLENAQGGTVEQVPAVPDEQLFDAIIAPYKGKVILVDFWNTWCGPCRAAIAAIEPAKAEKLKNDNLVWIYIADESSPLEEYQAYIKRISGKHFRLSHEQGKALRAKLGINSIPSYVLVEKDGSYSLHEELRAHEILIKTLEGRLK